MSFIELRIPGSEVANLHENIDDILSHQRTPTVDEGDTLQVRYNVDFSVDCTNLVEKLRSLVKIVKNPAVITKYEVDQSSFADLKECMVLLDFIRQSCQCDKVENLITRVNIFDKK